MQFTTFALSALSIGSALAQSGMVTVHVVTVSSKNNTLAFFPNNVKAAAGDMVQFQYAAGNHTVTQSTFDQPCQPINMNNKNVTGFYSGFMPVQASSTTTPTYTIMINNTTPLWLYCSQGKHCQNGMTMVINENPTANATRTLVQYAKQAALATQNLPGNVIEGGVSGSNSTSSSDPTATGTAGTTKTTNASGASTLSSMGWGSLAIAAFAALL